ncbi:MAG: RsmD family RNA methyltransferase, partial [Limnochordia bacterium]
YTNDVFRAIKTLGHKQRRFDFIYLDPPYTSGLADKALAEIAQGNLLADGGIAVVEHSSKEDIAQSTLNLIRIRQARYGDTVLSFYRVEGDNLENLHMSRQL